MVSFLKMVSFIKMVSFQYGYRGHESAIVELSDNPDRQVFLNCKQDPRGALKQYRL